ncbi:hypothetical protein DCC62_26230, partial [candidate division KSB1 bacterium]
LSWSPKGKSLYGIFQYTYTGRTGIKKRIDEPQISRRSKAATKGFEATDEHGFSRIFFLTFF